MARSSSSSAVQASFNTSPSTTPLDRTASSLDFQTGTAAPAAPLGQIVRIRSTTTPSSVRQCSRIHGHTTT